MKKGTNLFWVIIVLAMLTVVALFILSEKNSYNWSRNLRAEGEQPYDLDIFFKLLKDNTQEADFTELTKKLDVELANLDEEKSYNLYVIRRNFTPDTIEIKAIEKFIKAGNTLVLSADNISPLLPLALTYGTDSVIHVYDEIVSDEVYSDLPDSIYDLYDNVDTWEQKDSIHKCYQSAIEDKVWNAGFLDSANFTKRIRLHGKTKSEEIDLQYIYKKDTPTTYWNSVRLPDNQKGVHSAFYEDDKPAFTQWKVGKGSIVIAATPLLFTNYYMIQKSHFEFTNELLAVVPAGDILVDNIKRYNNDVFGAKGNLGQSPLNFILSQKALKWAWITLLMSALLFVVFRSKRKQRIIPVVKPNKNTTLAYAKMLGSLQLKEKNNSAKANEIVQHFFQYLRSKNRWHGKQMNDELRTYLQKMLPDLDREIQIVLHLGTKAEKKQAMTDQEVVTLFNYSQRILERI